MAPHVHTQPTTQLGIGDEAPWHGAVADYTGRPIDLGDFIGRLVLVYFFPRDQTTGCVMPTYGIAHGGRVPAVPVLAISLEGSEGQQEFLERTGGVYPVIDDGDGALRRSYGVPDDTKGHHHAFLVGGDGRILFTWSGIDVEGLWKRMARIDPMVQRQVH